MSSPQTCRSNTLRRKRRSVLYIGLAATFVVVGARGTQNAVANGDTRSLLMHHTHTGESINITFKRDGRYDEQALKQINWFLRDWRRDQPTRMDPHLFDIVWEVNREVGGKQPVQIISAYRSPATNSMLRARGRGVAEHSQHTLGKAMDFFIPDANLSSVREAGLRLQRGGVGFYPTSGSPFVHLDTGSVRYWPRMSRDQLARVFPDGKTVHLPADGRPLAGYEAAARNIAARGGTASKPVSVAFAQNDSDEDVEMTNDGRLISKRGRSRGDVGAPAAPTVAAASVAPTRRSLFAWLRDKEDEAPARPTRVASASTYAPADEPRAPVPSASPHGAALALASVPATEQRPVTVHPYEPVVSVATANAPGTFAAAPPVALARAAEPELRWVTGPSGQTADAAPTPRPRPALAQQQQPALLADVTASIGRTAPAALREAEPALQPPLLAAARTDEAAPRPARDARTARAVRGEPVPPLVMPRVEGPGLPRLITTNRFGTMPVDLRHPDARAATPLLNGGRGILDLGLEEPPVRRALNRVADAAAAVDAGRRGVLASR